MKIAHITIQTSNFEKEILFYEQYTGMIIQRDFRPAGRNMVFLSEANGCTEVEIIEKPDADDSGNKNLSIGFRVEDDLEAMRNELIDAGFEVTPFVSPAPEIRFFFVKDPAGMNVQFM